MLDLKRCAIKMASNIKVVDSKRGKVTLKNDLILRGLRNNCEYEELIKEAIMTMKEINKVEFFYEKLNLVISYDCTVTSEKKVVIWIKSIIEIILDNYEELKSIVEKNNKEEVKNDNNDKKESKDSENDTKAKKEEKSSENEEVVTVKDGVITIPKGFKIAEITFDYNRKNIVELNEVQNYSDLDKKNILGAIIGKNPLEVGNIDGDWNYNTFIMYGFSLRYPDFFEIQKSEMPDLEGGITLKSKDKKIEFSAGLNDNHDGKTAKDELDIENKCNEKDSKILISNLEGNTYTFACEKNGLIIYEYGIVEGPDSDIPVFIYRYPAKYKDTFDKIIEESKKSFVPTKGFPREVNNNSNKVNDKKSNNVQSKDNTQIMDIKEYGLTPDEAIKLFYKNDPKGLKTQNEVDKFLIKNYKSADISVFYDNLDTILNNFDNNMVY
ncbi:hypothetical protein LI034_14645, partial [Clostridium perfringens]|uniref:hypothetical protein n=8 Tax=Clostridium perfringens TaxID=1502 RepID=UPI0022473812